MAHIGSVHHASDYIPRPPTTPAPAPKALPSFTSGTNGFHAAVQNHEGDSIILSAAARLKANASTVEG